MAPLYWIILILCCTPLYFVIAWTFFDSREHARDSFVETIVMLLKAIFIHRIVRVMLGMDEEDSLSILMVAMFIVGCIAITWGIHLGVQKFFG
jgi:hypothetical protein